MFCSMQRIKYFFIDIDGTLTDGKIYYSQTGDEIKAFNIKDGFVISSARKAGFEFVVITGRESMIVEKRMRELGVLEIYQGIKNKRNFFETYTKERMIDYEEICYIGDDLNDLAIMKSVGNKACPADACEEVKRIVDYISVKNGGDAAVRDILEYYLKKQNDWNKVLNLLM